MLEGSIKTAQRWAMNFTRIGILVFASAAVAGPWYTVDDYSPIRDVISLLGAQNTPNRMIMVVGFLALGAGIVIDGVREFSPFKLPFITFGCSMGLAGILAHRPLSKEADFNLLADQSHSVLATLAGISITVGLLIHAGRSTVLRTRITAVVIAALCLGLPLCMLAFPNVQGLLQRFMYLILFIWLWSCYPSAFSPRKLSPGSD